jgi:hypothetical protein
MTELEDAIRATRKATDVVTQLRDDLVVSQLLSAVKTAPLFRINETKIENEMNNIDKSLSFKHFRLDGEVSIESAAEARQKVQTARDRLVALNREYRSAISSAQRVYQTGAVYLRQQPALANFNQKTQEDVIAVVLSEISEYIENIKRLFTDNKEMLTNLDKKEDTIDSWFALHKQYTFRNLSGPRV